jgi:glyoxylate reductase
MMSRVFVTRRLPTAAHDLLQTDFDIVSVNPHERNLSKAEIISGMAGCDVLICLLADTIDREVIDSNPHLKGICNYAVGYNNIDFRYAISKGITVCNTPGVLTETTADLTWALLMAAARRIVEGDQMMRQDKFPGWEPLLMLGVDIFNKTLGIIGMGRIGKAVSRRALGFGMKVVYYNQSGEIKDLDFAAQYLSLEELLTCSDFISIHAPLTAQTTHLLGRKQFEAMKETAVLINTARGAIIDEAELVVALQYHTIFAAGLDVYEFEPSLVEGLVKLPNVVLAPHIGSASIETRTRMATLTAQNALAILHGAEPPAKVML